MRSRSSAGFVLAASMFLASASLLEAQEAAKREMLEDNVARFWIYDDITGGNSVAALTGKPLLVLFRCVT